MSAAQRYWDSPTAGMPPDLAAITRKNLASEDASISGFNDKARYLPTPIAPHASAAQVRNPVPASSFQFGLNGANDSSQLSLNGIPGSQTANGVPVTNAVSRVNGALPAFSPTASLTGPGSTFTTSPDAYKTSPDAYHQVISTYKPRDLTKERSLYGWGE